MILEYNEQVIREMAKLVLAYIRGKIPLSYINRNVKFIKK